MKQHWRKMKREGAGAESLVNAGRAAYIYGPGAGYGNLWHTIIIRHNHTWAHFDHDSIEDAKMHVEKYMRRRGWWER